MALAFADPDRATRMDLKHSKSKEKAGRQEAPRFRDPRIPYLTAFTINFSHFEVHFSCSVRVPRKMIRFTNSTGPKKEPGITVTQPKKEPGAKKGPNVTQRFDSPVYLVGLGLQQLFHIGWPLRFLTGWAKLAQRGTERTRQHFRDKR